MSEPTGLRTLAVRITEDERAQLDVVAQINGRTVTEEIRTALAYWIEKTKSDPAVLQKAEQIKARIERDAQTQRNAITAIFGSGPSAEAENTESSRPATRRSK